MPGTPTNPPTAMVAASMPVAKPTGMVNHMEMRTPAVLKVIMGQISSFCRRWARVAPTLALPLLSAVMAS